jgi:phage shock protein C
MSQLRIARNGVVIGDYSLSQVQDGLTAGNFLATDDALVSGAMEWVSLGMVPGLAPTHGGFAPPLPPPPKPPPPPLPSTYNGLYRSGDEKVIIGLCGGLAHKLGVDAGLVRFGMVVTWFFTFSATFWIYWLSLFLPRLPTRNIPRS